MFYITFIQAKLRESQIQSDSALTKQIQAQRFNSMTKTAIKTSKIRVRNKTEKIRDRKEKRKRKTNENE